MPKEIVYETRAYLEMPDGNEYREGSDEAKENENTGGSYHRRGVHVGWMPDMEYVELGVASFHVTRDEPVVGTFIQLDNRRQINDLIKNLRKARDRAFGSDE